MSALLLLMGKEVSAGVPAVPFAPSQVPTEFYIDAADDASINHSANAVNTWNDKSGKGRHISGTLTQRPTYDDATNKVTFDGVANFLFNTSPFLWALSDKAIYLVANITTGANKRIVGETASPGSARYWPLQTGNSGGQQSDICPNVTTDGNSSLVINRVLGAPLGGAKKIIRVHEKDGMYMSWINGALASKTMSYKRSGASVTPSRFCIGANVNSGPTNFTAMDLYELIIVDNDTYGEQIEGYLAHKHGLTADLPVGHRYKTNPPLQGDTTSYPIPDLTGVPLTAALFGDSLTAANSRSGGGEAAFQNNGYFVAYNQFAGNRVHLPVLPTHYNKGVSGSTLNNMSGRLSDLTPLACDVVFFMGGTNSTGDGADSMRAYLDLIISHICLTLGKICIWLTITPKNDGGSSNAATVEIRDYIMSRHGSCAGRIISVNVHEVLDSGGGTPIPNALVDSVHYTPYGAMKIGEVMDAVLAPYLGRNVPDFTTGNLLSNGTLSGTGGTGAGQVATGWTFSSTGPAPLASKDGDDYQLIQSNFTATGADGSCTSLLQQTITTGYSNGDVLYGVALIEAENVANIAELRLEVILAPNAVQTIYETIGSAAANGNIPEVISAFGQHYLITPALPLTSGSITGITVRLYQENDLSGVTTTSKIKVKGMGLFKR